MQALKARARAAIRAYPHLLAERDALKEQNVTVRYEDSGGRGGGGVSRTTEAAAIRELPSEKALALAAVESACNLSAYMGGGKIREDLIGAMYWTGCYMNIAEAADVVHISREQAQKYHADFVNLVCAYLDKKGG